MGLRLSVFIPESGVPSCAVQHFLVRKIMTGLMSGDAGDWLCSRRETMRRT